MIVASPPIWRRRLAQTGAAAVAASLAACATTAPRAPIAAAAPPETPAAPLHGTMKPYAVNGIWYRPHAQPDYDAVGVATWYGAAYHNRQTADGEVFDMDRPSAAHTTLPIPCIVEVTNLDNGRRLRLRVNDRGPFSAGRILDVSRQAAKDLGFYAQGSARVRVRYVGPAPPSLATAVPAPMESASAE